MSGMDQNAPVPRRKLTTAELEALAKRMACDFNERTKHLPRKEWAAELANSLQNLHSRLMKPKRHD